MFMQPLIIPKYIWWYRHPPWWICGNLLSPEMLNYWLFNV